MNGDLDLIRAFRAKDAVIDASSQHKARAALLEHIDGSATGKPGAQRRELRHRIAIRGIRTDTVVVALSILVVVSVGAAFLIVARKHPSPARRPVVESQRPPVIRNFSPRKLPALPGLTVCTAELTRAALSPGGVFWPTTCQFQPPGIGGSPNGTFRANSGKVNGANERAFSITASGLRPNTRGSVYAVWLLQAAKRFGGATGIYRLLEPQRPRLLGVIQPAVGGDGKLAAQGLVPPDVPGGDYLLLIAAQPHRSVATPGRTVLHGFISLPSPDS